MSLGAGAYKVGGAEQCSSMRKEVSMATLQAAPTRHCVSHWTVQWNTYQPMLTWPWPKEGGRDGKKHSIKWQISNKLLRQHFAKNRKQATAYASHQVTLLEALGHP